MGADRWILHRQHHRDGYDPLRSVRPGSDQRANPSIWTTSSSPRQRRLQAESTDCFIQLLRMAASMAGLPSVPRPWPTRRPRSPIRIAIPIASSSPTGRLPIWDRASISSACPMSWQARPIRSLLTSCSPLPTPRTRRRRSQSKLQTALQQELSAILRPPRRCPIQPGRRYKGSFSFSNLPGPPTGLTLYTQSSSATDSLLYLGRHHYSALARTTPREPAGQFRPQQHV